MSFEEKFQAGEAYGDPHKESSHLMADAADVAEYIWNHGAGVQKLTSRMEIMELIRELLHKGEPIDDKKGTTELLISILTSLPSTSKLRTQLTSKFIDRLWSNLQHPPLSYVGGDVEYEVVNPREPADKHSTESCETIEFKAPDSDIVLRERIPKPPDGTYQYRLPDGSFNSVLQPNLGKAGTPYAKSVRPLKRLQGVKPDAGLLFDLLMARDDDNFVENPAGISSMLFYHASIIIHDIFRTNRTDMNVSDTSSYLDLAPLYGSSLKDQLEIRTMKEGKLKPDTFHEKRLLGQPAGVNVMLVLYSRFHNYVADILLKINENGRFTLACPPNASPEDKARAVAKQDHDIFNTARLIVGGLYVNISLHDYLRAITNTHHSSSDWTLDPRIEIGNQYDGEGVPRGVGNQVSVEFNLIYRFHSCISKKDERWINDFLVKLFPGRKPDDLSHVSHVELGQALVAFEQNIPKDPSVRTFDGLERQADGTFRDEDLVRILKEAMEDPAGAFGARMVPKALKVVEVLGINQARKWQVASLNEFRDFFGLKRYDKFSEINSNEEIATILEKLYADPDMVELYPGLMIEDIKPVRNPGCGICPTYSVGRAILSDAITLVRSDRFNTIDYTVANLTSWGYNEVQQDSKTLGGSMLYKLIQRGVPGWFPFNSVAVMQPMYTKKANATIAQELGTLHQYTLDDPKPPETAVVISTHASIRRVLDSPKQFAAPWLKAFSFLLPGKKDWSWFMLTGDEAHSSGHETSFDKAIGSIPDVYHAMGELIGGVGAQMMQRETFRMREGLHQLDLMRDIAIPLLTRVLADLFYLDLRSDENPNGTLGTAELYRHLVNVRVWADNSDSGEAWNRRRDAQESLKVIIESSRKLVDEVARGVGFGLGVVSALTSKFTRKAYVKDGSLRSCGLKLVEELLSQGNSAERVVDSLWLTAVGCVGHPVNAFSEVMGFFLLPENASLWADVQDYAQKADDGSLRGYVVEAQRLTSSRRSHHMATQPCELEGKSIQPGNIVISMLGKAGRDPSEISKPDVFDAKRQVDALRCSDYGSDAGFGEEVALGFVVGLVKLSAGLKQLRPAPGAMGQVKTIRVGSDKLYLNDSWSYLSPYANTWKVHFSGHGKGNFEGDRGPTKAVDMQQYYYLIKKYKSKLRRAM
ncbi:heme peroxidase [Metarhizium album ARSEF 1941]|uniref:Heme peroxidase n=1 Tax=Metarhizium album (strain ARSEF 1941) TaxID=1081103 RepID=A0A0B2WYZ4_METAS|nr:heme peroxidase [Metarhizium album ARSEF 1941]KHN98764.1 heme peroxidase [Metarhizium album ARSEF 1941]